VRRREAAHLDAGQRARGGLRAFVDEWYRTDRLGRLERDVLARTDEDLQFELGRTGALQPWLAWVAFAVEEELRALVEDHVFDQDADNIDMCARPNGVSRRDSMESHHMSGALCARRHPAR
jgi:hypothetical protein